MNDIVKIENLKDIIIKIRGQSVLLDSDVARIYGVETRDANKAVANNPDKFPSGYIVELSRTEKSELVENFHRIGKLKHSTVSPKVFPKKGACICLPRYLKAPWRLKQPSPSSKLSQEFVSYRETSKNSQPYRARLRKNTHAT